VSQEVRSVTTQEESRVSAPSGPVAPDGVNHLVLNVRNMERSHEFWTRIMGFAQVGELGPRPGPDGGPGLWMRFYQGARGSHHDLALAQVLDPDALPAEAAPWSLLPRGTGINHMAISWGSREGWLQQIAWLQSQGVLFHSRVDHGMTHSVYISDPDGYGIEVLYELPREVWQGDINAALNYAKRLPSEGPDALHDDTDYKVFGGDA
jgi:catechol 2,3-dioxygenase